jgi:hypothetical protein
VTQRSTSARVRNTRSIEHPRERFTVGYRLLTKGFGTRST